MYIVSIIRIGRSIYKKYFNYCFILPPAAAKSDETDDDETAIGKFILLVSYESSKIKVRKT